MPQSTVKASAEKIEVRRFIECLQKSNLLTVDALRLHLRAYSKTSDQGLSDASQVGRYLVDQQLITKWHCKKLLSGRYRGFFLGDYKLLEHLGSGGMSSVYLAEHCDGGQKRAIKVLPRSRVGDRSYLDRFRSEHEATARLNHTNIVKAYGIGQDLDTYFIVMEFIEGDNLREVVRKNGPLPIPQAVRYAAHTARALHYAHQQGIIHRDIKPGNILITNNQEAKLLDLGLALSATDNESITRKYDEKILGTADYLSPEQALDSHNVDHRTDIYSLGCTLYFMLAGQPPFPKGTLVQRLVMHQSRYPADIAKKRPDCPEEIKQICERMLRKKPDSRYSDCGVVFEELSRWLASKGETITGSVYATLASPEVDSSSDPQIPISIPAHGHSEIDETRALANSLDASLGGGSLGGSFELAGASTAFTESQVDANEIAEETKNLFRSLGLSADTVSAGSSPDESLVFLPVIKSDDEGKTQQTKIDAVRVEVTSDSQSVLNERLSRQSGTRQSDVKLWLGIVGLFIAGLVALLLIIVFQVL